LLRSGAMQRKLRISPPGDVYELKADRVEGEVIHMAKPRVVVPASQSEPSEQAPIQQICSESLASSGLNQPMARSHGQHNMD